MREQCKHAAILGECRRLAGSQVLLSPRSDYYQALDESTSDDNLNKDRRTSRQQPIDEARDGKR